MKTMLTCVFLLFASAAGASDAAPADFQHAWGGYLTSSDFVVDPDRPGVVRLPPAIQTGDLLRIRPLRLNSDEYLILQRCTDASCSSSQVVRAWNAYGYMGPYPVLANTVRVQTGGTYLLWLQRVPTQGTDSFRLYDRDAPPLTFKPQGSQMLLKFADLEAAHELGPSPIKIAKSERDQFVVTFAGGSVVRMQVLRPARSAG